jgi:hypothetical protein
MMCRRKSVATRPAPGQYRAAFALQNQGSSWLKTRAPIALWGQQTFALAKNGAGAGSIHTGHPYIIPCSVTLNLATCGSGGVRVFRPENITFRWQPDIVPHHPLSGNATFEASRKPNAFEKR